MKTMMAKNQTQPADLCGSRRRIRSYRFPKALKRSIVFLAALLLALPGLGSCSSEKPLPAVVTLGLPDDKIESSYSDGIFTYNLYPTYAEVSGYSGDSSILIIPDAANSLPVLAVGASAFSGNELITDVTLPAGLRQIKKYAFEKCPNLTHVAFNDTLETIADYAFRNSGITALSLPDSVAEIGKYCFFECKSLTTVNIPANIAKTGKYAFYGCTSLTSFTIPERMTTIANKMFNNCTSLTEVVLPDNVTSLEDYAFGGCTGLVSLTVPASVTDFGEGVFFGCNALTLKVESGSEAEKYAVKNKYPYEIYTPEKD